MTRNTGVEGGRERREISRRACEGEELCSGVSGVGKYSKKEM